MRNAIVAMVLCLTLFASTPRAEELSSDACDRLAANPDDPNKVGPGVPFFEMDGPAAVAACRSAVEQNPGVVRFRYQLALALARTKQFDEALAAIRPAAEAGYAPAEADLGYLYRDLHAGNESLETAFHWSMLAAQQGYTVAMNDVAFCYHHGRGVAVDYAQALVWFNRAIERGDRYALKHLGDMYNLGHGVAQSDSEAFRLYQLSSDRGYRGGQTALGLMYLEGRGTPKDVAKAIELLQRAAAQEDAQAVEKIRELTAAKSAAPSAAEK